MGLLDFLRPKSTLPKGETRKLFEYENINRFFDNLNYVYDPVLYFQQIPARERLRDLYFDDEIAGAIDTRMEAAISTPWVLEGGSDEVNAFIYENVSFHIKDMLKYLWWCMPYGYSVIQIVYEQDMGRTWWSHIYDQPFESFRIDRRGQLKSSTGITEVNPFKWFHAVNKGSYHNPMGEPILAKLYFPYFFKCNGWNFYVQFLERWGAPFLHAKTDSTNEELKKVLEKLAQSKRPTSVVTGKDVDINTVESLSNGLVFDNFTSAITDRINRFVLGQTLTSGTGDTGSLALGQVHNEVRLDKKKADNEILQATVQKCIDTLFVINGFTGDIPQFIFQDPKGIRTDLADRDTKLHVMGVRFNEKYFEEAYDLSKDHFRVDQNAGSFGFKEIGPFKDIGLQKHSCKFAEADDPIVKTQVSLENEMIELSNNAFSKEELRSIIKSAKSPKDLQNKLAILMEKDSGQFEQVLTKALFMAKVKGFVDGKESV